MFSKDKIITWTLAIVDLILCIINAFATMSDNTPYILKIVLWIIFILILLVVLIYIVKAAIKKYKQRHVPVPHKKKIGILVSINTYTEESETFFENSFYQEFQNRFEQENPDLELILLPKLLHKKFDISVKDNDSIASELLINRILFYVQFNLKNDDSSFGILMNEKVITKYCLGDNYNEQKDLLNKIKKYIKEDIAPLSKFIKKMTFSKMSNIEDLEKYSDNVKYLCQYCVALSLYVQNNFELSRSIFKRILDNLNQSNLYNKISHKDLAYAAANKYVQSAALQYSILSKKYSIHEYLHDYSKMDELLACLEKYQSALMPFAKMEYLAQKARHIFISLCFHGESFSRDDYMQAVIANNALRNLAFQLKQYSSTARINEIFFMGFEGQPLWEIDKKINNLFRRIQIGNTNFVNIIAFIEETLEFFPNRSALYYILATYYAKTGQNGLANENYKKCLQYYTDTNSKRLIEKNLGL